MRFVANKKQLPKTFARHPGAGGIVAEADIFVFRKGRLAAKLIVFDKPKSMRAFWKLACGGDLGGSCLGAVNGLCGTVETFGKGKQVKPFLRGDRRYFCLIGLCANHLTTEIIMHEAVHAGFSYEKRVKRNLWGPAADFDEERIAYPSGAVGAAINRFLHNKGLYQ